MLELHAKYMLRMWIEHGESELVKAMEEILVFPRAGATVLCGCAHILMADDDSIVWGQVSAMIISLYENNLVTKSDIDAGMNRVARILCFEVSHDRFGEFFCQLAVKNSYTRGQLYKATAAYIPKTCATRINLIRVCLQKMDQLVGREFTIEYFWGPPNHVLLEEFLGTPAFSELFDEYIDEK